MWMRRCVVVLFWTVLAAVGSAARKPNVLLIYTSRAGGGGPSAIYTDDHGWADLGVQGVGKDIRTPFIGGLAALELVRTWAAYRSKSQTVGVVPFHVMRPVIATITDRLVSNTPFPERCPGPYNWLPLLRENKCQSDAKRDRSIFLDHA